MSNDSQHILNLLNIEMWQRLQDALSAVTGLGIVTIDYKGVPVTKASSRQPFCDLIHEEEELSKLCQKCDSHAGIEAIRLNKPYIYLCHYSIVDAAVPIFVDNKYIGAIATGQVFLPADDMKYLEHICVPSNMDRLNRLSPQYMELYERIPTISFSRLKMIVDMLFHLCNYIVVEAVENNIALEMYKATLHTGNSNPSESLSENTVGTIKNVKHKLDRTISNVLMQKTIDMNSIQCNNKLLLPAFQYINEHPNESCSLKQLAKICHVSESYFSKLFVKETGENFSVYILRNKINLAKTLLETTDKSISEISMDVGFNDAGHFSRTFKKYEGITPSRYRFFST